MLKSLIEGIHSIRRGNVSHRDGRRTARVTCLLQVICSWDRPNFSANIVDVSQSGMRLKAPTRLAKGEHFWVSLVDAEAADDENCAVEVEVVWTRKGAEGDRSAGLRYRDPGQVSGTWVQLLLEEAGLTEDSQRRRHIRLRAGVRVEVMDEDGYHLTRAEAADISLGGAQIKSAVGLEEGQSVMVMIAPGGGLPSFTVSAMVVRSRYQEEDNHHYVSMRFDQLSSKMFDCLRQLVSHLLIQAVKKA